MNEHSKSNNFAAPVWVTKLIGPIAFALLRIGQEYGNLRALRKATSVGEGSHARPGLGVSNGGEILIGRNVSFGANIDLISYPGGRIAIGDNSFIGSFSTVVSERATITIGRDVLIAENVSLRASNHGMKRDRIMRLQPNDARDIFIGDDVWIGKGVTVCAGATIADGCVIGANSVVLGSTEPYGIYVGIPIRRVKDRI